MNDFERDNAWQRKKRDEYLVPLLYGPYSVEGRYVLIDKGALATKLQKRFAVDTVVQGKNGSAIFIEEKIVRWPGYHYKHFCLETHSCTKPGFESDGWMVYGEAGLLVYGFEQEDESLVVYMSDFPKLQEWFWPIHEGFEVFGPLKTLNATMGRKVPIVDVMRAVPTKTFHLKLPDKRATDPGHPKQQSVRVHTELQR